jgi:hypothetical protein
MSDPKNPLPQDDFERDLAALSRAYGTAKCEEPPPAIDDAIRAAARRAVRAGPQARRSSWLTTWATPVATAAMLVLTVSIGLVAYRERPDLAITDMRDEMPARPQASAPAVAPAPSPATPAVPTAPPAPERTEAFANATPAAKSAAPRPFSDVAPEIDKLRAEPPAIARKDAPRESAAAMKESMPVAPAPVGETVPAPAQAPASVPARAPAAAPVARDSAVLEKRTLAAPAAEAPMAPAAAGRLESQSSERAAGAAASGMNLQRAKKEMADSAGRAPEAWLKEIAELRRDGKDKEALEELEKFRKRFPDYVLPTELKDLR